MPRCPPVQPSSLNPEQKEVYDAAYATCASMLGDRFRWKDESGALIGPLSPLLYHPRLARLYLQFASELGRLSALPEHAREVAILATGSVFDSRYELYAHERLAAAKGVSEAQIESVKVGKKPTGENALDEHCELAFDVALELTEKRGVLGQESWERATRAFGREGVLVLIHYVALYSYTCILLNAVDEPVP